MRKALFYASGCCADAVATGIKIIEKMGWTYEDPDEDGDIAVYLPESDIPMFEFIFDF